MLQFSIFNHLEKLVHLEKLIFSANITQNVARPHKKGLSFNCPLTLAFVIIAFFVHLSYQTSFSREVQSIFVLHGNFDWNDIRDLLSLFLYIFSDDGRWSNISYSMMLIVLIGPIVEERIGTLQLAIAVTVTAIITGIVYVLLFNHNTYGPTCIAYLLIFLASFVNVRKGEIPMSFILVLVVVIFIGAEKWIQDFRGAFHMISGSLLGWGWATMVRRVMARDA